MKIKLTSAFRIRKIENILLTRVLKFYAQYLALIFLVSSLIHYRKEIFSIFSNHIFTLIPFFGNFGNTLLFGVFSLILFYWSTISYLEFRRTAGYKSYKHLYLMTISLFLSWISGFSLVFFLPSESQNITAYHVMTILGYTLPTLGSLGLLMEVLSPSGDSKND